MDHFSRGKRSKERAVSYSRGGRSSEGRKGPEVKIIRRRGRESFPLLKGGRKITFIAMREKKKEDRSFQRAGGREKVLEKKHLKGGGGYRGEKEAGRFGL